MCVSFTVQELNSTAIVMAALRSESQAGKMLTSPGWFCRRPWFSFQLSGTPPPGDPITSSEN